MMDLTGKQIGLAAAGGIVVVALVVLAGIHLFGEPSPEELAEIALSDEPVAVRERAALDLADHGRKGISQMRRVAGQADEPRVRAAVMEGLGDWYDYESVNTLLEAMVSDPSPVVRVRAAKSLGRLAGMYPAEFGPNTPLPERQRLAASLRESLESMRNSKVLSDFEKKIDKRHGEAE
ncbi:MAG: HEAT repeat domain-containing protein [Phycisphaerae bacterium]